MSGQRRPGPYPVEVRERAVRMVFEHQHEYPSQWKAIESISKMLNVNHETLRLWVPRAETDAGKRPGVTTEERARIIELEREMGLPQVWLTVVVGFRPLRGGGCGRRVRTRRVSVCRVGVAGVDGCRCVRSR